MRRCAAGADKAISKAVTVRRLEVIRHCEKRQRRSNLESGIASLPSVARNDCKLTSNSPLPIQIWLWIAVFTCAAITQAQEAALAPPELTPAEIVAKVDEVRSPQEDYTVIVEVVSYSSTQKTKSATYEVLVKGKDKTIIKTVLPHIEQGRILLMRDNNLWAFLPEVSKPLRISLQERLIGEVAYGDIARVNFSGDYNATAVRTEKIDEKEYYVLELNAKNDSVTYGKVILWAAKETFWPLKAEFYAISGRLLKSCSYETYTMIGERLRPSQLVMQDSLNKTKKSVITYKNIQIGELPEKYFAKEYMKKFME